MKTLKEGIGTAPLSLTKKDLLFKHLLYGSVVQKNIGKKTTCGFTFANQPNHSVMVSNQQKKGGADER